MSIIRKKPTLAPYECDHCHRIWYGSVHKDRWVPEGFHLCLNCWSELDNYLYKNFRDMYNLSWNYMKPENIPAIHAEARTWIADPQQKPLRPKNVYRGGGIPQWLQSAINKGMVKTNGDDVYIVTVDGTGEAVSVETSQDRTLLQKKKKGRVHAW